MEADFDFESSIVFDFGGTSATDLVHFVETLPSEEYGSRSIFAIEAAIDATEGEFW